MSRYKSNQTAYSHAIDCGVYGVVFSAVWWSATWPQEGGRGAATWNQWRAFYGSAIEWEANRNVSVASITPISPVPHPHLLALATPNDIITLWREIRQHFEFISLYSSQKLLIIMSNFLEIQLKCERNILEMSYNWISWEFQLLHSKEKDFQHHPQTAARCWWQLSTHSWCLPFHWVRNGK